MVAEVSFGKPYEQFILSCGDIIRLFKEGVDESELVWHQDEQDRSVHVITGDGWQLQRDNELPMDLLEGHSYSIKKMEFHRLIKGSTDLLLRIVEV